MEKKLVVAIDGPAGAGKSRDDPRRVSHGRIARSLKKEK